MCRAFAILFAVFLMTLVAGCIGYLIGYGLTGDHQKGALGAGVGALLALIYLEHAG